MGNSLENQEVVKKVFTSSVVYLTLLQITYLIDKIYI